MHKLYSYALCPFCRAVRFYLNEKGIDYELVESNSWDKNNRFQNNDISIDLPIIEDRDKTLISGFSPIIDYFDESSHMNKLTGVMTLERLEIARICEKFNTLFFADVTRPLVYEKVLKRYYTNRYPNSTAIREAIDKLSDYMEYIAWLFERRNWLGGEEFSLSDIVVAAHISCLDYLGIINWDHFIRVKDWYVRIKSRPAFKSILSDRLHGVTRSDVYAELDF